MLEQGVTVNEKSAHLICNLSFSLGAGMARWSHGWCIRWKSAWLPADVSHREAKRVGTIWPKDQSQLLLAQEK